MGAFGGFLILLTVVWAVVVVWGVILWIRVGTRWLQLHPAPSSSVPFTGSPAPIAGTQVPAGTSQPVESAGDLDTWYGAELRAWTSANEPTAALAQRLGIGATAAAQIRGLAVRAASRTATEDEWQELRPWLPKILNRG